MSKAKPILKWTKRKGEWRAGPFIVNVSEDGIRCDAFLKTDVPYRKHHWIDLGGADYCKDSCERLARKIIAATKGKRTGNARRGK